MSRSFARRLAGLLLVGALVAPTAAHADSIVVIEGGKVMTAKPDGTGEVQLTDGGTLHSPTQADDGTIAVV